MGIDLFISILKNKDRILSFYINLTEINTCLEAWRIPGIFPEIKWADFAACDLHIEAINKSMYFIFNILDFKYMPNTDSSKE